MSRTALIACLMLASAPAFAGEVPGAAPRDPGATARIAVTVCERDALTQASFRDQHGPSPQYVTANDVLAARDAGERWAQARCMTGRQHRELRERLARN
ncbi:hypothetical protein [Brevundimonas subvibrioides]|uniref:hypothetical protein n=1 Tax=Brevundimonas subvibrioides TaxID=74313 RepID=UPI0022B4CFCC|nr:hypothetical protein [Brevundimonas subvibrioides]